MLCALVCLHTVPSAVRQGSKKVLISSSTWILQPLGSRPVGNTLVFSSNITRPMISVVAAAEEKQVLKNKNFKLAHNGYAIKVESHPTWSLVTDTHSLVHQEVPSSLHLDDKHPDSRRSSLALEMHTERHGQKCPRERPERHRSQDKDSAHLL